MEKNAFNDVVPQIRDILANPRIAQYVRKTLLSVLDHLEIQDAAKLVDLTLQTARSYKSIEAYERDMHLVLDRNRVTQRIPVKLAHRAQLIYEQIHEYLAGRDVLDLGCGDGKVGELIAKEQKRDVVLADVYENGNIANIQLPFVLIKQNATIPFADESMDCVLVLTVFHHSDDPHKVLAEVRRVTRKGGRVIVIESVFGVPAYGNLSLEEQRLVNIFFDHFYNRIIHYSEFAENKVNVPFNFQTPQAWNALFKKYGFDVLVTKDLGFDQKAVPEFHTLHVLEKV